MVTFTRRAPLLQPTGCAAVTAACLLIVPAECSRVQIQAWQHACFCAVDVRSRFTCADQ